MIFTRTSIDGVVLVELEPSHDRRGFFARMYGVSEFSSQGLLPLVTEASVSFNARAATLRGLHYQADPHPESKLVRCTTGAVFDVVVDLRPLSQTYCAWHGETLTAANRVALYVPPGCAHGFITLEDSTELVYFMDESYHPDLARGVRWDDRAFGIKWPVEPRIMSERDSTFADFAP